jgi:hypothetical protein
MPLPSKEQLEKIAKGFYTRWKFPSCIGCIDGKHCQLKCPVSSGSQYFNYLKYFSVALPGVADADKKFITIEVGARGKQSDGEHFHHRQFFNCCRKINSIRHPIKNCLERTSDYRMC